MKSIKLPSRSAIRTNWKTVLVIILVGAASFSIGVYANRVVVQQVQSLGGNHVKVPAPELQIINTIWNVQQNVSRITGVALNLTTVATADTTARFKFYQIIVQVSCLSTSGVVFTCSTGTSAITLPTSLNGASVILPVSLTPPIDPETTEVDDLSFIVTDTPVATPGFIVIANPSTVVLDGSAMGTVHFTVMSLNGFSGTVTVDLQPQTPGVTVTPSSKDVTLTSGGTVMDPLIVALGIPPGLNVICFRLAGLNANDCIIVFRPFCIPLFTFTAAPTGLLLNAHSGFIDSTGTVNLGNTTTVTKTLTSLCGYSGTVNLSESFGPPGSAGLPTASLGASSVNLSPGGTVTISETLTNTGATPNWCSVTLTNTATDGVRTVNATVSFFNVACIG